MYTADRDDGQTIYLHAKSWRKKELCIMKEKHDFSCPSCLEKVVLKLGDRQAWHFAHSPTSICNFHRTNESLEHLNTKKAIFRWLEDHQYKPKEEMYLPELRRKPDLCVEINDHFVVIEIQRSMLDIQVFLDRHYQYIDAGYYPIWIGVQSKPVTNLYSIQPMKQLQTLLIRFSRIPHIMYYNLSEQKFISLSHFIYLQPRKTFTVTRIFHEFSKPFETLINSDSELTLTNKQLRSYATIFYREWSKQTNKNRSKIFLSMTPIEKKLIPYFQKHHLNLNYFPSVCNIPLKTQFLLETPPHLWQTWIVLKWINTTPLNTKVSLSEICRDFYQEKASLLFYFRPTVENSKNYTRILIDEYFQFLCFIGVLTKIYPGIYNVNHHVSIQKTMDTLINDDRYILEKLKNFFRCDKIFMH
ncbi:competence protein CoiA [Salipaludibacillus sp. CF4.18]|uniref:competence protein CoiA n=1 Tax=Salipaludibacillus sp. CF4.18 TaxID=3373081 RepID=UPI003EE67031